MLRCWGWGWGHAHQDHTTPRFSKGIHWATGLFLRTPFTEGCAGANKKAPPPGRHQEQASKQRCTVSPTTFSPVIGVRDSSTFLLLTGGCLLRSGGGGTLPGGRASWRLPVLQPQEYMSATKLGLMRTFGHAPNKVKSPAQT